MGWAKVYLIYGPDESISQWFFQAYTLLLLLRGKQANQSSLHSLALLRQTKVPCKLTGMLFKLTIAKHLDFTLCQLGFDQ